MSRRCLRVLAPLLLTATVVAVQQPDTTRPRFRAGTNLVTIDAYVSKDGTPVTDLRADEVEILEVHHEAECVAARATTKAVVELLESRLRRSS